MHTKKLFKWGGVIAGITLLFLIYRIFNPYKYEFFPKCPFLELTGWKCPGCGSQRAIHFLLNFDFASAFKENELLVISIPYIITGAIFDILKKPNYTTLKWRRILFGQRAIYIILFLIIGFWILRNVI